MSFSQKKSAPWRPETQNCTLLTRSDCTPPVCDKNSTKNATGAR